MCFCYSSKEHKYKHLEHSFNNSQDLSANFRVKKEDRYVSIG